MFPSRPHRHPSIVRACQSLALLGITTAALAAEPGAAGVTRHRILNALDTASLPNVGAWMVDGVKVELAQDVQPRLGAAAVAIKGVAQVAGGKVDAPLFSGELNECQQLSLWVSPVEGGNVASVGFQVQDANGESLMQTVPLEGADWRQVQIDPTAGDMRQAYEQKEQNGKVDLPLRSVHVVYFAAAPGPVALHVDGLTARVAAGAGDAGVKVNALGAEVIEPGKPVAVHFIAENGGAAAESVAVQYTLQANPTYANPVMPDPVLGVDHAIGAKSTVSVDGEDKGDAKLGDGDESTGFETPWGGGYKEVVATMDLGQPREVSAVRWQPGDANWIFKVDVSASVDGQTFEPVAGAQGVDMHGKWGTVQSMPWPQPTNARYLRFRFHKDGEPSNVFRLPPSIMVYDGVANDDVSLPTVGEVIAKGTANASVPPRDFAELKVTGTEPLGPGAYLLGMNITIGDRAETRWQHLYVLPSDTVEADRARRFGINGSSPDAWMAENMRRCGFGWMRFENAKWMMYMPTPDRVAFDGSVQPWQVNHDQIFKTYNAVGLNVLPYVFQVPQWAEGAPANITRNRENYPPKDNADYGEAIFQIVARYGNAKVPAEQLKSDDKQSGLGLIDAVELWNEPNLNDPGWGPFVGTMPQYFEVMRAGAAGARRADPSLPITSGGLAGIDLEVVGQLSEYRYDDGKTPLDLVDVVNVHFYSGREEPELAGWDPNVSRNGPATTGTTYPEQLEDLVAWRDRLKPGAEIWITETGNDVGGPIGRSEWHQAGKVPRVMLLALAAGVERVFIYREAGSNPTMHAGAGLLRNDHSIRPAWLSVATMIRQMQGIEGRGLRLPSEDPNVWMFLWEQGDRKLITAWTLGEAGKVPANFGKATVTDGFGRSTKVDSTADVVLGYVPTYIDITEPSEGMAQLVDDARAKADARAAAKRELSDVPVQAFDFGPAAHVGLMRGFGAPRRFVAVGKDAAWNAEAGYGFVTPPAEEQDQHWVADPLDRDGVKVSPDVTFRFTAPAGPQRLRVRTASMGGDKNPVDVAVKVGDNVQTQATDPANGIAELTIESDGQPIEISIKDWAMLRWLTAIPESAVQRL
ncbi:MAG TPA: discoidin domain-containing protein [Tepidisphaeraceae bacterium]|jgi:hypothetical protein|nr:discoidin domain-containing protein [Tepidisphaeraceae bacterium]